MGYYKNIYSPALTDKAAAFFVGQRRQRRRFNLADQDLADPKTVEHLVDTNHLLAVADRMRREAGQAPGPDGIRLPDLGRGELADVLRGVGRAVLNGTYRPAPGRHVPIPKANGGVRVLTVRNFEDRIVARAVTDLMSPAWESQFLGGSHGFRPKRSTWTLLAALEAAMVKNDQWVLAVDDVQHAFDSVPIADAVNDHAKVANGVSLKSLIGTVLRGGDSARQVGIAQGCPFSPLTLNARLHNVHDLVVDQIATHGSGVIPGPKTFWFRYADNLVYLCQDVTEGEQMLQTVTRSLGTAGFALKGSFALLGEKGGRSVDLQEAGTNTDLLGFTIFKRNNRLGIKPGKGIWDSLKLKLHKVQDAENPTQAAQQVVRGWIHANGPAFGHRMERLVDRVLDLATRYGHCEIGSRHDLEGAGKRSYQRWTQLRASYLKNAGSGH